MISKAGTPYYKLWYAENIASYEAWKQLGSWQALSIQVRYIESLDILIIHSDPRRIKLGHIIIMEVAVFFYYYMFCERI